MPVIAGSIAFLDKTAGCHQLAGSAEREPSSRQLADEKDAGVYRKRKHRLWLVAMLALAGSPLSIAQDSSVAQDASEGQDSPVAADVSEAQQPAEVEFDSRFLRGSGSNISVEYFESANQLVEGPYQLSIRLNEREFFEQEVKVVIDSDNQPVLCFDETSLLQWGVKLDELPDQALLEQQVQQQCLEIELLIPGAAAVLDVAALRVDVSIPQIYLGQVNRGYISPSDWDNGITAGFVGYSANAFHTRPDTGDSSTRYNANLTMGFNIRGWRLRHNANVQGGEETIYQSINTYAQHDYNPLQAQFTVGEFFTPGNQFDSVPFTGVQLSSDDQMLPESERGFAPVVRGVANSNAVVTIRQNDVVIYETSVSPGEFAISDLYATSYAGDLDVTITEADGSEHRYTVPFSAVVQLLRPDASRFSVSLGQYREGTNEYGPTFGQLTYRRGINNFMTVFGGGILADKYGSALVGAAFATPVGAVSFDVTASQADDVLMETGESETLSGESYRISYSKRLEASLTNLSLAAYRFSTEEFIDFADYAQLEIDNRAFRNTSREAERFQMNISQPLGDYGSLGVSGIWRSFWDDREDITTFQASYSHSLSWGSLSLSANRDLSDDQAGTNYLATVSIPIGEGARRSRLSLSSSFADSENYQLRTSFSSTVGEHDQGNYQLFASRSVNGDQSSGDYGGNLQWDTPVTSLSGGASAGETSSQYSASASGTVLVHSGGLVFSPERGETMALIKAEGASGATLRSSLGAVVNDQGYALAANLTPYRYNRLNLDTSNLDASVELSATGREIVPTRGAIVNVEYPTDTGAALLIYITNKDDVPFASPVIDPQSGDLITLVGQGGVIYFRGDYSELEVALEDGSCRLQLPDLESLSVDERGYRNLELPCIGAEELQ